MEQKDNDAMRRKYEDMLRKKIEECVKYKVELQDKVAETQKRAGVSEGVANVFERYYGTDTEIWERIADESLVWFSIYQEALIDLECMTLKIQRLEENLKKLQADRNTNTIPPQNETESKEN